MPELPEAETIVRGLKPVVTGACVRRTRVLRPDLLEVSPGRFARQMKGRRIRTVSRRGKNVVLELDGPSYLVVNLGMTGGLFPLLPRQRNPALTHPGVRFDLAGGGQLVYNDARRFGRLRWLDRDRWSTWTASLGPEPLSPAFTAEALADAMAGSRSPVRSVLLDQRRIAGVGNIYAIEACYRARVHPDRPAGSLGRREVEALRRAIVGVLSDAVAARGTTIRDYRDADGAGGGFAPRLLAYGREGEPCRRCGSPIERRVFANRSAFYCGRCQPESPPSRRA